MHDDRYFKSMSHAENALTNSECLRQILLIWLDGLSDAPEDERESNLEKNKRGIKTMKQKNSGFTASGLARPEIRPGDIFKDKYGGRITIKTVDDFRVTYIREGYEHPCVSSHMRFESEFTLVSKAPPANLSDIDRIMRVTGMERIKAVREIIRERGKAK